MSTKIKIDKNQKLVQEAVYPVIRKNARLIGEMRKFNKKPQTYDKLSSGDIHKLTHKTEVINHLYSPSEFEVFFEQPKHIREGKEELYPETLSAKHTINYIKGHYINGDVIDIVPVYRNKKDLTARCIIVNMPDKREYHILEQPLRLLDEMFEACGYFRACKDKIYKDIDDSDIRKIQYEPYHYNTKERFVIKDVIYHITSRVNKESILESGFIDTGSNIDDKEIRYLPINYFFTKHIAEKIDETKVDENEVTLFYINTKNLKNIRFYSVPLFNDEKVAYTYDDISPEHISHYVDILI